MTHRFGSNTASAMDSATCSELLEQFDDEYNDLVAFAKQHGPEALNALLDRLGGRKEHIPTPENFWAGLKRHVRNEDMRARFRGNNYKQLALEYRVSEREARRIIHDEARTYAPKAEAPRVMKVAADKHQRLTDLAWQHGVSISALLDFVLDLSMQRGDLETRLRAEFGEQVQLAVGE